MQPKTKRHVQIPKKNGQRKNKSDKIAEFIFSNKKDINNSGPNKNGQIQDRKKDVNVCWTTHSKIDFSSHSQNHQYHVEDHKCIEIRRTIHSATTWIHHFF